MDKVDALRAVLEAHADSDQAAKMSAYMRDQFCNYGIRTPLRRKLGKPFITEDKKAGVIDWKFVNACWAETKREFQYVACDYLAALQELLVLEDIPRLETLVRSKSWWDTIDQLDLIIGRIGLRDHGLDTIMLEWSRDEDFWVRRIAIDHQLLRKNDTNTELLETILINNLGSNEFFINKAIGWALRDYSKTNPDWVRAFINTHRARMAPLSIREGSKYL